MNSDTNVVTMTDIKQAVLSQNGSIPVAETVGPTLKYFCFPLRDPVIPVWVGRSETYFFTKNLKLDTH